MNAYDIAKELDREGKFPGLVCYGTSPLLVRAANMLRHQADYIAQLEKGLESSIALNKAQAERQVKELTDEEIEEIVKDCIEDDYNMISNPYLVARAVQEAILRKAQEKCD